ncbi:DUF2029 domain-containing protein [Mycobacterium sp. SMC-2]|uniref:glycosyltransferase family 87 protein n=1 Tax=Mycobacterium sp. SMC-2 TaxID=2857058 RepID=UPI0021B4B3DA|nr:glycosyltransferase family 87 protein [Mycobacterium sp. SMC-2]UXA04247.1 DUF2029 domain-containing protein [Mycobacterium sp. SMC-2]
MNRPLEARHGVRKQLSVITGQSERTIVLSTILLVSAVSVALGYLLARCYSVDVLSSLLLSPPEDCWAAWSTKIGRHCFGDYSMVAAAGLRPNPWAPYPVLPPHPPVRLPYPAAGMVPHLLFALPAKWLGAQQLGLIGYLLALTVAVLSPAVWAARGARGLEAAVVFVALGAAAIPAWAVIDRGNSAGFVVPIALVFLVALRRERWGLVATMVVLAALLKPMFAVLVVALFAARKWRLGGLAIGGIAISNLAAYLLWPRDFPDTIAQSIHNIFGKGPFQDTVAQQNVSFGKGLLIVPDTIKLFQTGGKIPGGFLAGPRSLIGYVVLLVVAASLIALGRRMPPVIAGIVLLATAVFFPPKVAFYYLVIVLPIAALVLRDPDGPPGTGIFDRLAAHAGRRRAVGMCVSLATALSIAQVALGQPAAAPIPGQPGANGPTGNRLIVVTTVGWAPILWLVTCAVIIVSYARRPARRDCDDEGAVRDGSPVAAVTASAHTSEAK